MGKVIIVVVSLAALGALVFFGISGSGGGDSSGNETYVDGYVTAVNEQQLILRKEDGDVRTFTIAADVAKSLDLTKIQASAAANQKTRVFYETPAGKQSAVLRIEDAPGAGVPTPTAPAGGSNNTGPPKSAGTPDFKVVTLERSRFQAIRKGMDASQVAKIAGPSANEEQLDRNGTTVPCLSWYQDQQGVKKYFVCFDAGRSKVTETFEGQ